MADPLVTFALYLTFLLAIGAARLFKTLDYRFWEVARTPLIVGGLVGAILAFAPVPEAAVPFVLGATLTLGAIYARRTGDESEPSEGMALGALAGSTASILPLVFAGQGVRLYSAATIAGAIAGFGVTIAARQVSAPLRQVAIDLASALLAAGGAVGAVALERYTSPVWIGVGVTFGIPFLLVIAVFKQWSDVRRELTEEANLGVIEHADARSASHPVLRFLKSGWHDAAAHREFVRIATRMALRKRLQRSRSGELARIYQVEILKLRAEMQQMKQLDVASTRRKPTVESELPSGRIDY